MIAKKFAARISHLPITPNHITLVSLILTLISGLLFAIGDYWLACLAALLFMCVRFFDHLDGELARLNKSTSRFGHYFDWFVDTFSYVYLFITLAVGFRDVKHPSLIIIIATLAVTACLINTVIGLLTEKKKLETQTPSFPIIAGFGIDDSMYLIGPFTWAGYLLPFFLLSAIGSVVYTTIVVTRLIINRNNQ